MPTTPCPGCARPRPAGKYLCWRCWHSLTASTRQELNRHDDHAVRRATALFAQLRAGVPLADVRIPLPTTPEA